ncbi:MAG: hypothetical protein IT350_06595 [Deltaproteobacteria bacterium]|nr:hypothetical protein [Deltaproteobacteria bacterium]
MKNTDSKTKMTSVSDASKGQDRRKKIEQLRAMLGTVDIDAKSLKKLRDAEIKEAKRDLG